MLLLGSNSIGRLFYLCIFTILITNISFPNEVAFGSKIDQIFMVDIDKKKIKIPEKGLVTLLLFFDIDNYSQHKLLSELNDFYISLINQKKKIHFIGISRGITGKFKRLRKSLDIEYILLNDTEENIISLFDYNCGACNKIIIIDKKGKIRYNSPNVDFYFLEKVISRYERDGG